MLIRATPRFTAPRSPPEALSESTRADGRRRGRARRWRRRRATRRPPAGAPLAATRNAAFSVTEPPTKSERATTYNNFYEFGVNKDDPARLAHTLKPRPWTSRSTGSCAKPKTFDIDELIKLFPLEERVYSLRCVEAWSMVIPWIGFPLSALLKRVEPTGQAQVRRVHDAAGSRRSSRPRSRDSSDSARSTGRTSKGSGWTRPCIRSRSHGRHVRPGAAQPERRARAGRGPWKYGFKSAKSIVRIRLVTEQPKTAWEKAAPQEYGFYSNVNPAVSHPRWSQADERRIGEFRRRPTLAVQRLCRPGGLALHRHGFARSTTSVRSARSCSQSRGDEWMGGAGGRGRGRDDHAARVRCPGWLGSIWARHVRWRVRGTGRFDPARARRPRPSTRRHATEGRTSWTEHQGAGGA